MAKEFDLFGLAAAGGWLRWRHKHADIPPGTPCANCETPLQGAYCHSCGQLAEDFHKNIWRLFTEVLESFFHWDGRLFRTMPALVYKPGELTRNFMNGKRAYQVPPFRLFLVVLVVTFLVGHYATPKFDGATPPVVTDQSEGVAQARREILDDPSMTADEKKAALAIVDRDWASFGRAVGDTARKAGEAAERRDRPRSGVVLDEGPNDGKERAEIAPGWNMSLDEKADSRLNAWFKERALAINEDPERFFLILETWAHRVAVLALPVSALILSLLFVFQRRFFVYDHLIFSMHSLSFQLLLLTTIMLLQLLIGPAAWWLVVLAPTHLFLHMRGAYGTSWWGTLLRMFILFLLTVFAFSLLALLWLYLGFAEMGTG